MKKLSLTLCCFLVLAAATSPSASNHLVYVSPMPDQAFDFYENICWVDEKARLDNFSIQLKEKQDMVGLIVVYLGRRSCAGEGRVRGVRAKKWIEGRGVMADRIVWKNGGYRYKAETWLWVIPRSLKEKQWPILPDLRPNVVRVLQGCKGKVYNSAKCDTR